MAGLANIIKNPKTIVTDAYQQVALHNTIYRGKVLVDTTGDTTAPYTLAQLHTMVSGGDFSDIYVGDEIRVTIDSATVRFIVMAINWYLRSGDTALTSPHLVLVPKNNLGTAQMHITTSGAYESGSTANTTEGGYYNSDMHQTTLPTYATKISTALGGYILTWRSLMSNATSTTATSPGYSGWTGCSSGCAWYDTNCRLLSEVEVYGSKVWGNGYDVGANNRQLPGFALNPDLLIKGNQADDRDSWWLCAVTGSTLFAIVGANGDAVSYYASVVSGVVPEVLFG